MMNKDRAKLKSVKSSNKIIKSRDQINKLVDNFGEDWTTLDLKNKKIFSENPQKIFLENMKLKNSMRDSMQMMKTMTSQLNVLRRRERESAEYIQTLRDELKKMEKESQIYKYLSQKYQNKNQEYEKLIKILQAQLKRNKQKLLDFFDSRNYKQKKNAKMISPYQQVSPTTIRIKSNNKNNHGLSGSQSSKSLGPNNKLQPIKNENIIQQILVKEPIKQETKQIIQIKEEKIIDQIMQYEEKFEEQQTEKIEKNIESLEKDIIEIQKNIIEIERSKSQINQDKIKSQLSLSHSNQKNLQSNLEITQEIKRVFHNLMQTARLRLKANKIQYTKIQDLQGFSQLIKQNIVTDEEIDLCLNSFPFQYTSQQYRAEIIKICKKDCYKLNKVITGKVFWKVLYNYIDYYRIIQQQEELELLKSVYKKLDNKIEKLNDQFSMYSEDKVFVNYENFEVVLLKFDLTRQQIQYLLQKIILESLDLCNLKFRKIEEIMQIYKYDFDEDIIEP